MNGAALQWVTMAAYVALAVTGAWATHRFPMRPWGRAALVWSLNCIAFYVAYLFIHDGALTSFLIAWSAVMRLHGVLLAGAALLVAMYRSGGSSG